MKTNAWLGRMLCWFVVLLGISTSIIPATANAAPVLGTKKVVVLRVYFQDYAANSRYTQVQVQGFFSNLDTLWQNTSYTKININSVVTTLFQLPDNRSLYVDDVFDGDLSNGGKFSKVLNDAIANSPGGLDWTNVDAVMVVMAETDAAQFHRGQATKCNLPMGPGAATKLVGCAIFSENPTENDLQVWGRWAHEIGHTFQVGGPPHPSNYNSEFELMDSNYPGQTGVFEKQDHVGFPGWMPMTKYQVITPVSGGASAAIWAMEYNPVLLPNAQAVKIELTPNFYYLVSVRRRVLGDDLNGDFSPPGIPDEGVLIERVSEGSNPWVVVIGAGGSNGSCPPPACNRNALWKLGQAYNGDGVFISIAKKVDADNYIIRVAFADQAMRPDVMLNPWTSPPGNTWETTDIWVDSPVNGYGTYRYGMWSDGSGGTVPVGNGDDPAVGQVNRLYARVRNIGLTPATDVVVNWEITDPPGVGIAGATGWAPIGTVDKMSFPGLANIPASGTIDVYVDWTPNFPLTSAQLAAGVFAFHTCLRVKLNHLANETVFGNQDGDREQENISYFQATSPGSGGAPYKHFIRLHNSDLVNKKSYYLSYKSDLPNSWKVDLNKGQQGIDLAPGEIRDIPITIIPGSNPGIGSVFGVDVEASSLRLLVNDLDPKDVHPEYKPQGGVRVESRVLAPTKLNCWARRDPATGMINIAGSFSNTPDIATILKLYYNPKSPWQVMLEGATAEGKFLDYTKQVVTVEPDGSFKGTLREATGEVQRVVCLFAGTTELASAGSGFIIPDDKDSDGDRIVDSGDNCTKVPNPNQRDTNGDGFGNLCDADLNNDGLTTAADYLIMRRRLNTANADADLNGDGFVTATDYSILRSRLNQPPGPSGLAPDGTGR